MKRYFTTAMLFISVFLVFIVLFMAPTVILPVSQALLDRMNPEEMKMFFPLLLLFALYISWTFWLVIRNTHQSKFKVFLKLATGTFLLFPLMGLIESVFWLDSLNVVDNNEIVRIFLRSLITFLLFSAYLSLIYKRNTTAARHGFKLLNFKALTLRLLLLGAIYIFIYNLFGYFVAWQFEATRVFYTGSTELKGFFTMFSLNFSDPEFVTVHFLRGILFGLSGYIFYTLLDCSRHKMAVILALLFGAFGFQIIMPNPVFPEMVRISHFIETTTSMIIFGMIAGYVFYYGQSKIATAEP